MTCWCQIIRWSWDGEGDDAQPVNEVVLISSSRTEVANYLRGMDKDTLQYHEVSTTTAHPDDHSAWASADEDLEIDSRGADSWLERYG